MGIQLYLTFYNCVTASENAYATSSFGYSRDKFLVFNYWLFIYSSIQLFADSHLWSSSGQIISQNKVKGSFILWGEDSTIIERKPKLCNHQKENLKSSH